MSITVFFPASFSWHDATGWVADRGLPVTIIPSSATPVFAGQLFSRYCKEIDFKTLLIIDEAAVRVATANGEESVEVPTKAISRMVYHREKVQLRR